MKAFFIDKFAYHHWANKELLNALASSDLKEEGDAYGLMSHIFNADMVWISRLTGNKELQKSVWDNHILIELQDLLEVTEKLYADYLKGEFDQNKQVAYANSQGESFTNTVEDILTHVLMHGAYHRGQIAKKIKNSGMLPPVTDYIIYVRTVKQ